jgi:hypothetical protein
MLTFTLAMAIAYKLASLCLLGICSTCGGTTSHYQMLITRAHASCYWNIALSLACLPRILMHSELFHDTGYTESVTSNL